MVLEYRRVDTRSGLKRICRNLEGSGERIFEVAKRRDKHVGKACKKSRRNTWIQLGQIGLAWPLQVLTWP